MLNAKNNNKISELKADLTRQSKDVLVPRGANRNKLQEKDDAILQLQAVLVKLREDTNTECKNKIKKCLKLEADIAR